MDDVPFPFGPVGQVDGQAAFAVAQGQLHGVGQAAADAVLVDQAVHHQVDAVLLVLVQGGHVVQGVEGAEQCLAFLLLGGTRRKTQSIGGVCFEYKR